MKFLSNKSQRNAMYLLVKLARFVMARYKRFFEQDEVLMNDIVYTFIYLAVYIWGYKGYMILDKEVFDGYRDGRCVEIAEDQI